MKMLYYSCKYNTSSITQKSVALFKFYKWDLLALVVENTRMLKTNITNIGFGLLRDHFPRGIKMINGTLYDSSENSL